MKLTEIKKMFHPGQRVTVTREGNTPLAIVGNLGNTVIPAKNGDENRVVKAARSSDWVFTKADGRDVYTTHPKASEIIEAQPRRVKFRYDNGTIVTIQVLL